MPANDKMSVEELNAQARRENKRIKARNDEIRSRNNLVRERNGRDGHEAYEEYEPYVELLGDEYAETRKRNDDILKRNQDIAARNVQGANEEYEEYEEYGDEEEEAFEIIHNYSVEFNGNKATARYIGGDEDPRLEKTALKEEMRKRGFLCLVTLHQKLYFRRRD